MVELGVQGTHLLWAHLMCAVDKMSANQGESNGITQHGRLLQGHGKHLLKGAEMEAAEKGEGDLEPGLGADLFQPERIFILSANIY